MSTLAPVLTARVLLAWLLPVLLVLLVLMPAAASQAREPVAVTDLSVLAAGQTVALVESMQVLQQPLGQVSSAAEVLAQPGWRPATVANRNASWKRSAVWLTGLVTQHGDRRIACRITLGPTRIGTVEMLALDAQTGAVLARRLEGPRMLEQARTVDHVEAMLPFDLAPGQTVRLLIRAEDLTVGTTEVTARDESAYVRHQALSLLGEAVMFTLTLLLCLLVLCSRDRGMIVVGVWLLAGVCFESLFTGQLLLMLLPALLPWNVSLFTLLGSLGTGLFGVATLVLLRLDARQRWPMLLLASAALGVVVGLSAFFVTDTNPARMAVNRIGFVTLLLWPLAAWRTATPLDEERHRLRWMLTLSWAVLLAYVMLARGAPHSQALQLLQDALRLDRLVIGATLMVQFSIWRNRRRAAVRRAEFLAFHDALTGLPNRVSAGERLQQALDRQALQPDATLAVLYLDLDKFKQVNDTHGHALGDRLLRAVAERMRASLGEAGSVFRLSGDEFMAIVPEAGPDGEHARVLAEALLAAMEPPLDLGGQQVPAGLSIGMALAPRHGRDAETLMRHADAALYAAKRDGERRLMLFAPPMLAWLTERMQLRAALHRSLRQGDFQLEFQPQRRLRDGRITGVEALLRWRLPDGTVPASPARFIPVAEESGLIVPLGDWVLDEACRQAVVWPELVVAVNVSAMQFRGGDFSGRVAAALARHGLPAHRLELELTESVLIGHEDEALRWLADLRAMGVRLAIDDFGTGYSSLSYLHRFPVHRLKIDRSFILQMESAGPAGDAALVAAILQIARQLGLETVAEGVESPAMLTRLARMGCDAVQGHAIARPMPAEAMGRWLEAQSARPRFSLG